VVVVGGVPDMVGPMTAATGTVTGATYDLSLGVPVGPTDTINRRIRIISWWYWYISGKSWSNNDFSESGGGVGNPGISWSSRYNCNLRIIILGNIYGICDNKQTKKY
jgi:hypothetical protein